jgi:hypothetical protein
MNPGESVRGFPFFLPDQSSGKECPNVGWALPTILIIRGVLKSSWWHRHLAGAANRLEACATKGGGHGGPPHHPFHVLRVGQWPMKNCLEKFFVGCVLRTTIEREARPTRLFGIYGLPQGQAQLLRTIRTFALQIKGQGPDWQILPAVRRSTRFRPSG